MILILLALGSVFPIASAKESISIQVSASTLPVGESVTVFGFVEPPMGGIKVALVYTKPDGTSFTKEVSTACSGAYTDSFAPELGGAWNVKAIWAKGVSPPMSFTVARIGPLNLQVKLPEPMPRGREVKISATLMDRSGTPVEGAKLKFQIGSAVDSAVTDANGQATIRYTPNEEGSISVKVLFDGDAKYEGAAATLNATIQEDQGQTTLVALAAVAGIAVLAVFFLKARRK